MSYAMNRTEPAIRDPTMPVTGNGGGATPLQRALRVATSTPVALAVALVGIAALIGSTVAGIVGERATRLVTREMVATLSAERRGLEDLDRAAGDGAVRLAIESRMAAVEPGAGGAARLYLLVDRDGRRIGGSRGFDAQSAPGGTDGGLFQYQRVPGGPGGVETRWAVGVTATLGSGGRVIVARDVEDVRGFAGGLRFVFMAALAGLAAAGVGLGAFLSRRLEARIENVRQAADQIMAGDLARRIPVSGGGDELDRLSERLNRMLDRIEQLMTGMREISDNVAHDLKTPLSRLRSRAEAALRTGSSPGSHREALEHTIEAADEIIQTFNALLLIARLEAGVVVESFETFDVAALVRDLADLYEPLADEQRIAVTVSAADGLMVTANRHLIGQALSNLVDNALKYGRSDGARAEIAIGVRRQGDRVVLTVADRGPGIPADARGRVLGRFVRLDQSRSKPGSGLGLSLVAAVARVHGGDVSLADNAPGLVVELALPVGAGAIRRAASSEPARTIERAL